jgi:CHASE3 domain sensor protein
VESRQPAHSPRQNRPFVFGLGLLAGLLVANAWLSFRNTRQLDEDAAWVAHTHEVLDALEELLSTVKDAETGQRGQSLRCNRSRGDLGGRLRIS